MPSVIKESVIRHWVQFAPNPKNNGFPTSPRFVETRLVADLTEFPEWVNYVSFHSTVETTVQVGKQTVVVQSTEFDKNMYFVRHEAPEVDKSTWAKSPRIPVHPSLEGKVWVYGSLRDLVDKVAA